MVIFELLLKKLHFVTFCNRIVIGLLKVGILLVYSGFADTLGDFIICMELKAIRGAIHSFAEGDKGAGLVCKTNAPRPPQAFGKGLRKNFTFWNLLVLPGSLTRCALNILYYILNSFLCTHIRCHSFGDTVDIKRNC